MTQKISIQEQRCSGKIGFYVLNSECTFDFARGCGKSVEGVDSFLGAFWQLNQKVVWGSQSLKYEMREGSWVMEVMQIKTSVRWY